MPEKRRRGQGRLASLETLSSVPPFHGGGPGACLRLLADRIRTICLQIENLPFHGLLNRDASSAWPEREMFCCCLLPNDSVSFHQNETQKKSGPQPTEMDNDPGCLPEPEERYTGFILKAHLMQAEEEKQAGAKVLSLEKLKWTRKD
ncbi:hypothetical protein CRENBAI_005676 [Crenichthys baileyi]|uniref:Uncharacterized protein n=1 Tax=Crenichthys baileyi TaxID=28760 RepID=A0AAV9SMK3_9TELE